MEKLSRKERRALEFGHFTDQRKRHQLPSIDISYHACIGVFEEEDIAEMDHGMKHELFNLRYFGEGLLFGESVSEAALRIKSKDIYKSRAAAWYLTH